MQLTAFLEAISSSRWHPKFCMVYIHTYICIYIRYIYIYIYIYAGYVWARIYLTHMYIYIYIYMFVCMRATNFLNAVVRIPIYIYISYIYIHHYKLMHIRTGIYLLCVLYQVPVNPGRLLSMYLIVSTKVAYMYIDIF